MLSLHPDPWRPLIRPPPLPFHVPQDVAVMESCGVSPWDHPHSVLCVSGWLLSTAALYDNMDLPLFTHPQYTLLLKEIQIISGFW